MLWTALTRRVPLLLSFSLICLLGGAAAQTHDPLLSPSWKGSVLGRMIFDSSRERRKGNDYQYYKLNESGEIRGEDLFALLNSLAEEIVAEGGAALEKDLLRQYVDRGMASLILNRILDQYAMQYKLDPQVSSARVRYVRDAILVRTGMDLDIIPSSKERIPVLDENGKPELNRRTKQPRFKVRKVSNELYTDYPLDKLYEGLKSKVKGGAPTFVVEWQFDQAGLGLALSNLKQPGEFSWPKIELSLDSLPATVAEFTEAVRAKLQEQHRILLRKAVWQLLIQSKPVFAFGVNSVSEQEMAQAYEANRENLFKIPESFASVLMLEIRGAKAKAFLDRLQGEIAAKTKELSSGFSVSVLDPEAILKGKEAFDRAREQYPNEVYSKLLKEFAPDMAKGDLVVFAEDTEFKFDGVAPMFKGCKEKKSFDDAGCDEIAYMYREAFFNQQLAIKAIPMITFVDWEDHHRVMFVKGHRQGKLVQYDRGNPLVEQVLRGQILLKKRAAVFRSLAFQLFSENRYFSVNSTCSEAWPCSSQDPAKLTLALFPEMPYPGVSLPSGSNSLLEPKYLPLIQAIADRGLERVFQIQNR